ncbi:H/ACA ribonucleoprotein complex subunit GAR1 [Halosegnis longus]|uniref:H/ACA RNA-protein complex component Gar1 n=1 Tax=Halosegnis longus TaxID=2216012 RepID=A0AAJ4R972_9EURY|nr:Gar1/Naf1 family protein [Halosegnis longus]RNJ26898.1 H/ACA RNA-protein complex component Gar1 [Salella cibi]
MNRLGEVVSTAQGLLVLRPPADTEVDIGTTALDESLDAVGRVVDVFGPVDHPYVAVTPDGGTPDVLLGTKLYAR